jgi:hypothetical protein
LDDGQRRANAWDHHVGNGNCMRSPAAGMPGEAGDGTAARLSTGPPCSYSSFRFAQNRSNSSEFTVSVRSMERPGLLLRDILDRVINRLDRSVAVRSRSRNPSTPSRIRRVEGIGAEVI